MDSSSHPHAQYHVTQNPFQHFPIFHTREALKPAKTNPPSQEVGVGRHDAVNTLKSVFFFSLSHQLCHLGWGEARTQCHLQRKEGQFPGCFGIKLGFQMAAISLSLTFYWKDSAPAQTTTHLANEEGEARRKRNQMWTFPDLPNNRKLVKHVTE